MTTYQLTKNITTADSFALEKLVKIFIVGAFLALPFIINFPFKITSPFGTVAHVQSKISISVPPKPLVALKGVDPRLQAFAPNYREIQGMVDKILARADKILEEARAVRHVTME